MNEHLPNKLFLEKFHLTGKAKSNLSAFCNVLSFRDKLNLLREMNLSKQHSCSYFLLGFLWLNCSIRGATTERNGIS